MDCALCLLALYRNIGFLYVKSQINKKQKNKFLPATIDYLQRVHQLYLLNVTSNQQKLDNLCWENQIRKIRQGPNDMNFENSEMKSFRFYTVVACKYMK